MNILTTTAPNATLVRSAPTAASVVSTSEPTPAPPKDTFKKNVTRAAYASGGALGGLALGAVSGEVMSHLTQNPIFSSLGGGVGAIGGAATSLALSLSDEPVSIGRTFGSWAGASAGATGGMYLMRGLGEHLATFGAAPYFGTHGALIGAVGIGLAGTGVAFSFDESKVGKITKSGAKAGAGAALGMMAGGTIQSMLSSQPQLAPLTATAPFVLAGALALVGVQNEVNRGWLNGYEEPKSKRLDTATKSAAVATLGYAVGSAISGVALSVGGSAAYSVLGPSVGAAVGAVSMLASIKKSETLSDLAATTAAAGGAAVLGDAIGHGLTALTGQPAFQILGAATSAVTGASAMLGHQKRINKYVAPITLGFTSGTVTGTLLGAGLTALTGHSAYQLAGTIIGAAAGVFAGMAGGAAMEKAS